MLGLIYNMRNNAVTQNSLYLFNGFGIIQDSVYGINSDGISTLFDSGLSAPGVGISAYFSFVRDFGMSLRFRYIYISGEFSGNMLLTLTGDDSPEKTEEYTVVPKDTAMRQHTIRVPIRRSNGRAGWWKFRISNTDGSYFAVHRIEAVPIRQENYYL